MTELQMAESDGLDLGCGKGVGRIWLDLGFWGVRADKSVQYERRREIMHPCFWPNQLGDCW